MVRFDKVRNIAGAITRQVESVVHKVRKTAYKVKRAVSWGVFMYSNEWWDSYYLYSFLDRKLAEMEVQYRKHGVSILSSSYARIIRLAREYLKRASQDYWQTDERYQEALAILEEHQRSTKRVGHAEVIECVTGMYLNKFLHVFRKYIIFMWD